MKEVDFQPLIDATANYLYFQMVYKVLEPFLILSIIGGVIYGGSRIFIYCVRNCK